MLKTLVTEHIQLLGKIMWEKIRGVFLMPSNEKNATNFFSSNI